MTTKYLFLDVETTGTSPIIHDIYQIAYIIDVDGKEVLRNSFNVKPFSPDTITQPALNIGGYTKEEIMEFPDYKEVKEKIVEDFKLHINIRDSNDKMYPVGFHVYFDMSFLAMFFKKCNDRFLGSFINWRRLDIAPFVHMLECRGLLKLKNYKLKTVCEHFSIELEDAHDAMSDIVATRELFHVINKTTEFNLNSPSVDDDEIEEEIFEEII